MIEIAIHDGSPGLANRIKNYAGILRTFKQALTVNDADAYIFDNLDLQRRMNSLHILVTIIGDFQFSLVRIVNEENISTSIFCMKTLQSILLNSIRKRLVTYNLDKIS